MVVPVQAPRTLYDKIWDDHVVCVCSSLIAFALKLAKRTYSHQQESGETLLYIDRSVIANIPLTVFGPNSLTRFVCPTQTSCS